MATTQVEEEQKRGLPTDIEEILTWSRLHSFSSLPPKGQEAFFWFLRGENYPEDEDIIDIPTDATGMCEKSIDFQLWVKQQNKDKFKVQKGFSQTSSNDESSLIDEASLNDEFIEFRKRLKDMAKAMDTERKVKKSKSNTKSSSCQLV